MLLGLDHHQVAVHRSAGLLDERSDRGKHDRAHRDRLDKPPVSDVEVEDARAGVEELTYLRAEVREVRRVE
jgi:predicted nucleotidyltransferase